jgi:hypothetical protein
VKKEENLARDAEGKLLGLEARKGIRRQIGFVCEKSGRANGNG